MMYYVMLKAPTGEIVCQGGFSHEFAAYAKQKRVRKQFPYRHVEIIKGGS